MAYMLAERLEEMPRATAAAWLWDDLELDQALANLREDDFAHLATAGRDRRRSAGLQRPQHHSPRSCLDCGRFSVLDTGDGPAALSAVENIGDLFKTGFLEDHEDDPSVRAWMEEKRYALLDRAGHRLFDAGQAGLRWRARAAQGQGTSAASLSNAIPRISASSLSFGRLMTKKAISRNFGVRLKAAGLLAVASWAMVGNHHMARAFAKKAEEDHPQFEIDKWLAIVPVKENWQREHYREGLLKAGF